MSSKAIQQVGRNAAVIAVAGLAVRALGLVREMALAYYFGAGALRDALAIALRVPSVLRDLFAEGSMAAAFVPAFTEYREQKGKEAAFALANLTLGFILVVLGAVVASFVFLGKWWVLLFAGGFADHPETLELATQLTALAGPYILLVSMATLFMGMLNVHGRFFLPALTPALLNVAAIAGCFLGGPLYRATGVSPVAAVAAAYTVGGIAQFAAMYPTLRKLGYRFRIRIDFRNEGVKRIVKLMVPGLLGLAAIQLTNIIDMQVASRFAPGVVSYVEYSFRLVLLPVSMVGMALATATLAKASLDVASKDPEALRATVSRSVVMLFLIALPVAGMLIALAEPIIQTVFVAGEFTFEDAAATALLLQLYAVGVAGFCYPRVIIPIFFTLGDSLRPMTVALLTIGLKLAFVLALLPLMSYPGLVLATSIAVSAEAAVMWWLLRRRIGSMLPGTASSLVRILIATVLMVALAWGTMALLPEAWDRPAKPLQLVKVAVGGAVGGFVYLAACAALRVRELGELIAKLRSRLRPPGPPPGAAGGLRSGLTPPDDRG